MHDHAHGGTGSRDALVGAVAVTGAVLVVEVVAGLALSSLVLLGDAAHVATDLGALGLALGAVVLARRGRADQQRSFGLHRLEVLAALVNAALLIGASGAVLIEAAQRLAAPQPVAPLPLLAVGVLGLVGNLIAYRLLRPERDHSMAVQGAVAEVLADAAGSVAVILAGAVGLLTSWPYADPLLGSLIGVLILPRAVRLGARALRVLVQAAPPEIPVDRVEADLAGLSDVVGVHDLHVWTLTSGMEVASAHVVTRAGADAHDVLDRARDLLGERYGVEHATLQIEPETHEGCEQVRW